MYAWWFCANKIKCKIDLRSGEQAAEKGVQGEQGQHGGQELHCLGEDNTPEAGRPAPDAAEHSHRWEGWDESEESLKSATMLAALRIH